jgi:hypothetical protein
MGDSFQGIACPRLSKAYASAPSPTPFGNQECIVDLYRGRRPEACIVNRELRGGCRW